MFLKKECSFEELYFGVSTSDEMRASIAPLNDHCGSCYDDDGGDGGDDGD